ncbi:MAG: AMP-dependent synthetase/ligase [Burkholderiaceae bacterium]
MTAQPPLLPDSIQTLPQLWQHRVAHTPDAPAYKAWDATARQWRTLSWAEADMRRRAWRLAVAATALPRQSRIAILLPNGLDALCADQATLAEACVPVPLHAIDNPGSIAYILQDCEASMLIVGTAAQWEQIRAVGTPLPALQAVVVTQEPVHASAAPSPHTPQLWALADWLQAGAANAPPQANLPVTEPQPEDLAAIVYTSGTTGKPKGVMLTHHNVVSDVRAVLGRVQPVAGDVFLSFLPLSHTFERTAGYYLPIATGSCVAYARSVAQLAEDLQTVRPTVLISVPRIYERIYAKLQERLGGALWKRQLFEAAQHKGWKRFCALQGLPTPTPQAPMGLMGALPWPLLRALVARPLLAQLGGRVRVAVSGGAALSPTIARCFLGLGLPLVQGYGMTETAPVVAVNALDDNHPATVGRPLPGIEVRLGDLDELQIRGPVVMKGYWRRPEDTARILSADGWLSTGDQADLTGGRIRIKGRIKEIIVTSTGEKVPPADLELALQADPLLAQTFVIGEHKPFIACIAVVAPDEWKRLAADLGLPDGDDASLNHPAVHRAVLARIEKLTAHFARYAVPRAVYLTREAWTIENALLTPTLKLKRLNLLAHFAPAIEAIYRKPGG